MKQFLHKLALFSGILVAYLVAMYLTNSYFISRGNPHYKNVPCLVMGDSYLQYAIDPQLYHSVRNYAQAAEPYFITYWKLQNYLKNNKVDTLFLGLSHHSISSFNDHKLHDPEWSMEMFRRIYPIEQLSSMQGIEIDWYGFYKVKFKNLCLYPKLKHANFEGSHSNNNGNNLRKFEEALDRHYSYGGKPAGVSQIALQYLHLILRLCKERGIKPILVSTPLHPKYRSGIPAEFKKAYKNLSDSLREEGIVVLDCSEEDYPDDEFLNPDHINKKGTKRFASDLKRKLDEQGAYIQGVSD